MPRLTTRVPKYRLHKPSGLALVTLDGKDHYLGKHGSQESRERYHRLASEWQARRALPLPPPSSSDDSLTVSELFLHYWEHVQSHYRKGDRVTTEADGIRYSLRPLIELYGDHEARSIGPLKLKTVRQHLIDQGQSRPWINKCVCRIRRMFKWGVSSELVPASVLHALQSVDGLRRGRSAARETDPVGPAPQDLIDAVLSLVSRQVAAMIQLQIYTGMRPGEVVIMRPCDIDRSGEVWAYAPESHKTEHHGKSRRVFLGPKAQRVLMPFLNRATDAHLFSPAEAEEERRQRLHAKRKTPLSCGNRPGTNRKCEPKKKPRECYDVNSYRRAIQYACKKAFPVSDEFSESRAKAWRKEHSWHPHQLRHNAATFLAKEYGIEAAQVILGHVTLSVTQVYAERDYAKAAAIMRKVG